MLSNKISCMQLPPHLPRRFQNKGMHYINRYQPLATCKRKKIAPTLSVDDNNQSEDDSTHLTEHVETVDQPPKNQFPPRKQGQSTKRELCSSNTNKKFLTCLQLT